MTDMMIGGHYRFVGMPEKLVYLGHNWSANGYWHQFARADIPDCPVWAEITDSELNLIEGWTDD